GGEEPSGQTPAQTVKLSQVTAYLGEHLVTLKAARNAMGLLKTEVVAQDCLFASATGKSLVHLDRMENDAQVRRLQAWAGSREHPNVYSGFSPMLDQLPRHEDSMLMPFDREGWLAFTQEPPGAFERVRFGAAPAAEASWAKVAASQFRARADGELPKCGADIEALAKLFDDAGSAPASGGE